MPGRMHLGVPFKGPPAKYWCEDPTLRTGRFTKNELVASVLDQLSDQDVPAGSNPPSWRDFYRPTRPRHLPQPAADCCQNFLDRVMTRNRDGRETWVPDSGTPVLRHAAVSSLVSVPKEA